MTEVRKWLASERDAAALAVFRMAFGLLVTVSAIRFLAYGWVDTLFDVKYRFTYWGFQWVPSPGVEAVRWMFIALIPLGLMVTAGALYRVAMPLLFVTFTWIQLLDVSTYLNHYYLVCLLAALMCFMPLHAYWSVDARFRPALRRETLPTWCTMLLRFQVGTVYVFAAIAKFNGDWLLHGAALHLWLSSRPSVPVIGPWLHRPEVAWFMSWCGFLFDASAPFLLSFRRTRPFAYVAVLAFHLMTSALFPIGMFPFIMILSTLVFFDASWPRRFVKSNVPVSASSALLPKWAFAAMVTFVAIQLAIPLRTFFYGGDVSWHEQGMRFSWRVMTREKNGTVTYVVKQKDSGREWHVSPRTYLNGVQERELAVQPDLILQLAQHIGAEFRARGVDVEVHADTLTSLNGRRAMPLIDPNVDLLTVRDGLAPKSWILPAPTSPPLAPSLFSSR
ncbi:MAG: gamma carboxylase [Archangium gephyra]|uniref:Gamma carboxylase n=1 Tax=Archangium gephyra TaxID=48 RepID=A0A2W5TT39_9BACT|nr:MAG: gamma carboxylase [Archangium gephyra]